MQVAYPQYIILRESRVFSNLKVTFLLLVCAATVFGQAESGRAALEGRVLDPSAKAIHAATVTVVGKQTGTRREVTTDADGLFRAGALQVGSYDVEVNSPGFAKSLNTGITLLEGTVQVRCPGSCVSSITGTCSGVSMKRKRQLWLSSFSQRFDREPMRQVGEWRRSANGILLASRTRTLWPRRARIWLISLPATMSPNPINWFSTATMSEPSSSFEPRARGRCMGYGVAGSRFSFRRAARCEGM